MFNFIDIYSFIRASGCVQGAYNDVKTALGWAQSTITNILCTLYIILRDYTIDIV
jgi:hypothetical protein